MAGPSPPTGKDSVRFFGLSAFLASSACSIAFAEYVVSEFAGLALTAGDPTRRGRLVFAL